MEEYSITKAVLAALSPSTSELPAVERSLAELERLLETAGGEAVAKMIQVKSTPESATYIGSGKLIELADICKNNEAEICIFDCDLTPSQIRNIEDAIDVRVIDRSMLILDIFALHAITGEGKIQVELAQLQYSAPRLTGHGKDMSRLGGGIGTRGPGESKLETDKRHLQRRIEALQEELERMEKNRSVMRASRDKSGIKKIAIVGYTNAGKSTLLNNLTDAGILAEDKLFATLDPTTRKFTLPCGEDILLTDTVGFIRKLPHNLIKAFRSTLSEASNADILLIVIDASDEDCADQLKVTEETLNDLGASDKPTIYVLNKCDAANGDISALSLNEKNEDAVFISALNDIGIDKLVALIEKKVLDGKSNVTYKFSHAEQGFVNVLYKDATVEYCEYTDYGVIVKAIVDKRLKMKYRSYEI